MNWGFALFTQIVISVAVVILMGWTIFAVVRAIVQQRKKK